MPNHDSHVDGLTDDKVLSHEEAAHEKRNWVRLTFDCNDHCVFCLDTDAHNGTNRDREEIKHQILDGRQKGAERLILSGGEPTIHPNYVDFIRLGRAAGYPWIQTVTNGRLFSYGDYLKRCLDAGLQEITFSLHGPNAKIHDALVGVKGAFDEETTGLRNALADGRPVINIDVCVNRANVKHLPEMLEKFISWGVKEFDLLQVIPFGNAFQDGRDILFYDIEEMQPYLQAAFAYSKRPDVHIWLNRFPPAYLEGGYEHLIQDPYKLNDEVKGRREEFDGLLERGKDLVCRQPERCHYCYLEQLCDTLYAAADTVRKREFDIVRLDTEFESQQGPVWGGDPASKKKSLEETPTRIPGQRKKPSLPILGDSDQPDAKGPPEYLPLAELMDAAESRTLWLVAPDLPRARAALEKLPAVTGIELELEDYAGLLASLVLDEHGQASIDGKALHRVVATSVGEAQRLLAVEAGFLVVVELSKASEPWLLSLVEAPSRLVLRQPTHEKLSESAENDVDLRAFFAAFRHAVPVEGIPACVLGREPNDRGKVFDASMMRESDGHLEIFRYAKRYIMDAYVTKSLRCKTCVYDASCKGMHVNYVRAHGYGVMQPVVDPARAALLPAASVPREASAA